MSNVRILGEDFHAAEVEEVAERSGALLATTLARRDLAFERHESGRDILGSSDIKLDEVERLCGGQGSNAPFYFKPG
jgi:hypothetical protein